MRLRTRAVVWVAAVVALASAGSGLLLRAQLPQAVGTWAPLGAVAHSRVGAAAVSLSDGRTVIAGGMTPDGIPTDDVAVYDPAASSFTSIGHLIGPRVGHTATLLKDGRLLVAGGTMDNVLNADLELFDPSSGSSTLVALMAQLRSGHAAARLADGRVLIVGGSTAGGAVLHSAELFDPSSGSVTMLPFGLRCPRVGASATTLIDGRVLVAGGRDGATDLGSAEIYDAYSQTFTIVDTQLSVARSGHTAVLLPNNNSVLIAGGTSDGVRQPRADLFLPAEFPDPYSYGTGRFAPTGEMTAARSGAIGGPTHVEGYAFVMGGGPADAEAYRFATIKTDKDDYAPGELAIITGSGWQPGEDVTLVFQEDPAVHDDYVLTVTANSEGNIYWDQWSPESHDLGVRFYLMAKQPTSQGELRAQTTFTDNHGFTVACNPASITVNTATSCTATVTGGTGGQPSSGRTVTFTSNGTGTFSPATAQCTTTGTNATASCSVNYTPTAVGTGTHRVTGAVAFSAGGHSRSSFFDVTVAAANTAPVATVVLNNHSPQTNDMLTATATRTDADGDAVSLRYVWKVNGTVKQDGTKSAGTAADLTDTFDLSVGGNGNKGDTITVEVTPNDGTVNGTTVADSAVVVNIPPTATSVLLNDTAPKTNDTISVGYTYVDADGDAEAGTTFQWQKKGPSDSSFTDISGATSSSLNLATAGNGDKGDQLRVLVTPKDGSDFGTGVLSNVATVVNTPPTATNVLLSDTAPKTNDTISVGYTYFDADGDAEAGTTFQWQKKGPADSSFTDISGATSSSLNLATVGNGDKGDQLRVLVTPKDGSDFGPGVLSNVATVVNTPPVATNVLLSDTAPKTNDTISVGYTYFDADGDAQAGTTFQWQKKGPADSSFTDISGATSSSLNLATVGNGDKGDQLRVLVTPKDGSDFGPGVLSNVATVVNTPPVLTDPGAKTVAEGSPLSFTLSATDADGDALTFSMSGHKDTPDDPMSLVLGAFSWTPGDNYIFVVRFSVSDGDEGSDSKMVNISSTNVNPTASNPSLTYDSVTGEIKASLNYEDVGWHDTHVATFNWTIDGVPTSHTVAGNGGDTSSAPPPREAGMASKLLKLAPGCYSVGVSAVVRDDDGGESAPLTIATPTTFDVYTVAFGPPIMNNERNIAKYGNVVPVKVRITSSCTGAAITSVPLFLSYVEGTGADVTGTEQIAESVSAADGTGGQMRIADSMSIYNFTTKPLVANRDYTLRVKPVSQTGPVILSAVLQPKK